MSGAYSQVDASGSYLANVILKNGRNEVQTYPISHREGALVDESMIKRHELEPEQIVSCVAWFNDVAALVTPKKSKKRTADDSAPRNGEGNGALATHSLLAVALETGETFVFSPLTDAPVAQIATGKLVSLTRARGENRFWGLSEDASLLQIHTLEGVEKTVKFAKTDADVALVNQILYRPKKSSSSAELMLLASTNLYMVDGSKSRKNVLAEFEAKKDAGSVAFIFPLDSFVAVARDLSSTLSIYDLSEPSALPRILHCKGSNITRLASLSPDLLMAFTEHGAEVFSLADLQRTEPSAFIKTDHNETQFENVISTSANGVVGVWYDGNQPQFAKVSESTSLEGECTVPISHPSENATQENDNSEVPFAVEETVITNVGSEELFSQLSHLLTSEKVPKKEVLRLCSSNDNEDSIKDTIRLFSQSEKCCDLVENLFEIVSKKVASDPSRKSSLSIWLKWVLLAHGGYISKQEKLETSLALLQTSLDDGMKLMPKLLALQGRLQLLKSQAELRNKISTQTQEEESEPEDEYETFNETFNNTTNIEESVVYANGENDDDFDSIEQKDENGPVPEEA